MPQASSQLRTIASQPSWVLRSSTVELALTRLGGHMAPVTFFCDTRRPVQPYYISPWQDERLEVTEPVLAPLRGDFFCLPFGAGGRACGHRLVVHGQSATARWRLLEANREGGRSVLRAAMRTTAPRGNITKIIRLLDGQNVVYVRHVLEGFSGRWPLGHHATLAAPQRPGSMLVATGPTRLGMTAPTLFSNPALGEYQSLAIAAVFRDLRRVPLIWREPSHGDCSALPAREGFADLLACVARAGGAPAWTTATVTRGGRAYLWFSLKDARVLPTMVMWIENHGRHGPPWNGRNRCVGLEDVCACFAEPCAVSARPNALTRRGVATAVNLSPARPTAVNYIQGLARVPNGFGRVSAVRFSPGKAVFVGAGGRRVEVDVRHEFLATGSLP